MSAMTCFFVGFSCSHPVGSTYTQFPQQDPPETIFNKNGVTSTWSVLNYGGAFFRSQGGNAETFKSKSDDLTLQAEGLPNITGQTHVSMVMNSGAAVATGAFTTSRNTGAQTPSGGGSWYSGYDTFSAQKSNPIYGASSHVTPMNYTIRIWERTK